MTETATKRIAHELMILQTHGKYYQWARGRAPIESRIAEPFVATHDRGLVEIADHAFALAGRPATRAQRLSATPAAHRLLCRMKSFTRVKAVAQKSRAFGLTETGVNLGFQDKGNAAHEPTPRERLRHPPVRSYRRPCRINGDCGRACRTVRLGRSLCLC